MKDQPTTWEELRRIADELELKMHLASMDIRDQWQALKPRLTELEKSLATAGKKAGDVFVRELESVEAALKRLREDIKKPVQH
jgi:hypothetical protein